MEKDVKARTKGEIGAAKTLCSPFEQPALDEGNIAVLGNGCSHYCCPTSLQCSE